MSDEAATSSPERLLDCLGKREVLRGNDEVLGLCLPLLKQTLEAHERGKVAPLEGVEAIHLSHGRLWFENAKALSPRRADGELRRVQKEAHQAPQVVGRFRSNVEGGVRTTSDLMVGKPGERVERPVFMPRYLTWEQEVGHHDALTDIFILGLIIASVALDTSLGEKESLEGFAAQRHALPSLNGRLHPVIVRAIVRMTEVNRHKRVQDLRTLIETLTNYRDQVVDDEIDLLKFRGLVDAGGASRQEVICRHLRDRLFDFTRRNRLLFYRPTGGSLNLTVASVPLSTASRQTRY